MAVLHEQGHRQVNPRDGEQLHQRARVRRSTEGHEEAQGAAARRSAVALDNFQSKTFDLLLQVMVVHGCH